MLRRALPGSTRREGKALHGSAAGGHEKELVKELVCGSGRGYTYTRRRKYKRGYKYNHLVEPVCGEDEGVARSQLNCHHVSLFKERVAAQVGVRHVDEREVVDFALGEPS